MVITSVGQGYESMEGHHDYKTSTGTTYGGRGQPMDIGKSNDNFKARKLKCFNCNKYGKGMPSREEGTRNMNVF